MSDFVIWLVILTGNLVFVPNGYPAAATVDDLIHYAWRTIAFRCVPRIAGSERSEPFQHDRIIVLLGQLAMKMTEYPVSVTRLRPDAESRQHISQTSPGSFVAVCDSDEILSERRVSKESVRLQNRHSRLFRVSVGQNHRYRYHCL